MQIVDKIASGLGTRVTVILLAASLLVLAGATLLIDAKTGYTQELGSPTAACPPSEPALPENPAPSAASPTSTSSTGRYLPAPEEIVVCVGTREITGATFTHWAEIAEHSGPAHRPPALAPDRTEMEQVLDFLISAEWVLGEAKDLGVKVTDEEVARHFDQLKRQQFPKNAEFQKFLASTGQTVSDLMLRVKLSMLSERIQKHVVGHATARSQQRALMRFVKHFQRKWKAQTYCEPQYEIQDCGHTASSL
jgi:hypothetical protein